MSTISNNCCSPHGGYYIVGHVENWKANSMFGGKRESNPVLTTIDFMFNDVRKRIRVFENVRNHYVEKVVFVLTYKDYIQTPHLDIDSSSLKHIYIIHVPLCNGECIHLWERGDGKNVNRDMIYIQFGSMIVARSDVRYGGILLGKGNMRFHAAIIVHKDSKEKDELVYRCDNVVAKRTFDNLKVDYKKAKKLLGKRFTETLPQMVKYLMENFILPQSYYKNLK